MFKVVLSDPDLLRIPISTIAELIDEGVFHVAKDGISLLAADRAMVAVVDFKILANAFEEFKVEKESDVGLNVSNLLSILKRAGGGEKIEISTEDSNRLKIALTNSSRRRFLLPIIEISQEEIPPIDQLEFSAKVEIKPDILAESIKDAEIISDVILIEASKEGFRIKAEGDISQTETFLEKGNENLLDIKANDTVDARYPLDYLKKMIKAAKLADSATIEFAKDYPMKLSFNVTDKLKLAFVLAPRVIESE